MATDAEERVMTNSDWYDLITLAIDYRRNLDAIQDAYDEIALRNENNEKNAAGITRYGISLVEALKLSARMRHADDAGIKVCYESATDDFAVIEKGMARTGYTFEAILLELPYLLGETTS